MPPEGHAMLDPLQLRQLHRLFGAGAEQATLALSRWLDRPAEITVERVEQIGRAHV